MYHMGGVSTEVIKNIVLSGIGTLTIVDEGLVTERDLAAGFFYRQEEFGTHVSSFALEEGSGVARERGAGGREHRS